MSTGKFNTNLIERVRKYNMSKTWTLVGPRGIPIIPFIILSVWNGHGCPRRLGLAMIKEPFGSPKGPLMVGIPGRHKFSEETFIKNVEAVAGRNG